jgi:hypothetical protein
VQVRFRFSSARLAGLGRRNPGRAPEDVGNVESEELLHTLDPVGKMGAPGSGRIVHGGDSLLHGQIGDLRGTLQDTPLYETLPEGTSEAALQTHRLLCLDLGRALVTLQ